MPYKKSLLVICKISKLFPNTLSADGKYFLSMRQFNATNSDGIISKTKNLSPFFSSFLKSSLNLEHFRRKMTFIADVFPKLRTPKNIVRSMPKKSRFRGSLQKQQAKCAQTLFKLERHPHYHIS